jgi:DNA (cytosine-5)-methyltransferase 1
MKNTYTDPSTNDNYPVCIDLFSGAGGLTLGFCQAGGLPIAAVDNDPDSIETYKRMFPMCEEVFCGDIEQWKPNNSYKKNVDVVIGGPPCQGFSLARGLRFVDDPRNHLYKEFVRLVSIFQPKWFVLENVQGITNIGDGIILKQIYEDFNSIDYKVTHQLVNMAEYGVPQLRKRAVFVGNNLGKDFRWPEKKFKKQSKTSISPESLPRYRTINEALSDLPWDIGSYFAHRANSKMRGPRNRDVFNDPAFTLRVRGDEFAFCEKPATKAFIPDFIPDESNFFYLPSNNEYQIAMRETPPSWIMDYKRPEERNSKSKTSLSGTRRLAIREQARLQSFPDWFQFYGRKYSQASQIGNAVPPLFAKQLFEAIFQQSMEEENLPQTDQLVKSVQVSQLQVNQA